MPPLFNLVDLALADGIHTILLKLNARVINAVASPSAPTLLDGDLGDLCADLGFDLPILLQLKIVEGILFLSDEERLQQLRLVRIFAVFPLSHVLFFDQLALLYVEILEISVSKFDSGQAHLLLRLLCWLILLLYGLVSGLVVAIVTFLSSAARHLARCFHNLFRVDYFASIASIRHLRLKSLNSKLVRGVNELLLGRSSIAAISVALTLSKVVFTLDLLNSQVDLGLERLFLLQLCSLHKLESHGAFLRLHALRPCFRTLIEIHLDEIFIGFVNFLVRVVFVILSVAGLLQHLVDHLLLEGGLIL